MYYVVYRYNVPNNFLQLKIFFFIEIRCTIVSVLQDMPHYLARIPRNVLDMLKKERDVEYVMLQTKKECVQENMTAHEIGMEPAIACEMMQSIYDDGAKVHTYSWI